jgi:hypothetical protein
MRDRPAFFSLGWKTGFQEHHYDDQQPGQSGSKQDTTSGHVLYLPIDPKRCFFLADNKLNREAQRLEGSCERSMSRCIR